MKRLLILLGIAVCFISSSCTKKAADVIVGHWEITHVKGDGYFPGIINNLVWEFDADGTLRCTVNGAVCEGFFAINGSVMRLSYYNIGFSAKIIGLNDNWMRWVINENDDNQVCFERTVRSASDNGGGSYLYCIYATALPWNAGYVEGDGYFEWYGYCTLTAVANPGYVFINWTEDGEVVSDNPDYSFAVTRDRFLVANFEQAY